MNTKKTILQNLINELFKKKSPINFCRATNGIVIPINTKINSYITKLSDLVYSNLKCKNIDQEKCKKIVYKTIINLFSENKFQNNSSKKDENNDNLKIFNEEIKQALNKSTSKKIIYHILALSPFHFSSINMGPISITCKKEWIKKINFSPSFISTNNVEEVRKKLIESLYNNNSSLEGFSPHCNALYTALKESNYIISVESNNEDYYISPNSANFLAKISLDILSLIFDKEEYFFQNTLKNERLPPETEIIFQSLDDNGLSLQNYSLNQQSHLSFIEQCDFQKCIDYYQPIFSHILYNLTKTKNEKYYHSILAKQWCFALSWYAEGVRETNNAIALVKLSSCLDTLSSGGKAKGIIELVCNILNKKETDIFSGDITTHQFISKIYNDGRSRIIHGTLEDIFQSFNDERTKLTWLARQVLIISATRLYKYKGIDDKNAFKSMK